MRRGESEDKLLCCLNLGTIERSQRRAPGDLLPKKKTSGYLSVRMLDGPQSQPGRGGAEKCLCTCQESLPSAGIFID